jgi:hypothetical protein
MDPFARFSENHDEMSDRPRSLRVLQSPPADAHPAEDDRRSERTAVAFLQEWRAAKIPRSRAMHPTNLARAVAAPALRPVP